jgi:Bacterial Ig domain
MSTKRNRTSPASNRISPRIARLRRLVAEAVVLGLLIATAAAAKPPTWWEEKGFAEDSAFWWSLTDNVSPPMLREYLLGGADLDGAVAPEWVPMWLAFAVATAPAGSPCPAHPFCPSLASFAGGTASVGGLSLDGRTALLEALDQWQLDQQQILDEVDLRSRELLDLLAEAVLAIGEADATLALGQRDVAALAAAVRVPESEVIDLLADWLRSPLAEASVSALETLQAGLSAQDWDQLRGFLLASVAPRITTTFGGSEAAGGTYLFYLLGGCYNPDGVDAFDDSQWRVGVYGQLFFGGPLTPEVDGRQMVTACALWEGSNGIDGEWHFEAGQAHGLFIDSPYECLDCGGAAAAFYRCNPVIPGNIGVEYYGKLTGAIHKIHGTILALPLRLPVEFTTCEALFEVGGHLTTAGPNLTVALHMDVLPPHESLAETVVLSNSQDFHFQHRLPDGAEFTVSQSGGEPQCRVEGGQGVIAGADVTGIVVCCGEPGEPAPSDCNQPPEGQYTVSATIMQAPPANAATAELFAGPDGGSLQLAESRELGFGQQTVTFSAGLPDGYGFQVNVETEDPDEDCPSASGTINGGNASVSITCTRDPTAPPPIPPRPPLVPPYEPPEVNWITIVGGHPVDPPGEKECDYSSTECHPVTCPGDPPETTFCEECNVVCTEVPVGGQAIYGPTLTMTVPDTGSFPIPDVDDVLTVIASAHHPSGVRGFVLSLDGDYLMHFPVPTLPSSFTLPVTSIDTSGLVEGPHELGVHTYGENPAGTVWTGVGVAFEVDHQGGGGGSDTTPPTVAMVSPANGQVLQEGTVLVTASASDASGIDRVEFYRNGALQHTDTAPPYTWSWQAEGPASHQLKARAVDASPNANAQYSAPIYVYVEEPPGCGDSTPPTVGLTSPTGGATYETGDVVTLSANASDPESGIDLVAFYVDGSQVGTDFNPPYSVTWTATGTGSRTITAKAWNGCSDLTTSSPRTITIVPPSCGDSVPPTVQLTDPPDGEVYLINFPIPLAANASDNVGVTKVEFYVSTLPGPVAVDYDPPYSVTWEPPYPDGEGQHEITAKAYDACNATTSAAHTITVECHTCGGPQ